MATKSFIKTIGSKGLLADYNTEGKKLQTELIAGDNVTIDGNTISSDQVFVAKYGTTTYKEIKYAYDAGKICTVLYNSRYYYLVYIHNTYIRFVSPSGSNTTYSVAILNPNKWVNSVATFESKLTFDTAPTAGSNNPVTSDGIKTALDTRIPAPTSTTGTQVLKCINGVIQWVTE